MFSTLSPRKAQNVSALLGEGTAFLIQHQIHAARLESEHILSAILDCERLDLFLHAEKGLSNKTSQHFWVDLKRRANHEPLQYITGHVTFCDMTLNVSMGVFIPRPETELIVEEAEKLLISPQNILDLCTGSGALAIALSKSFPLANVVAVDCSDLALDMAIQNAALNDAEEKTTFLKGDLFEPLSENKLHSQKMDLIVSNPPYISESDRESLPPEVRDHEPEIALFAEEDGRAFYRRILWKAPLFLADEGLILLELGHDQSEWLRSFVETKTVFEISFIQDWAGIERIARISKRTPSLKEPRYG